VVQLSCAETLEATGATFQSSCQAATETNTLPTKGKAVEAVTRIMITTTGVRLPAIGAVADLHLREVVEAAGEEDAIAAVPEAIRDRGPHLNGGDPEDAVDRLHHVEVHGDVLAVSVDLEVDHPHHAEDGTTVTVAGMSTIVIGEDPLAVTGADLPMTIAVGGTTIEGAVTITVLQGEAPVAGQIRPMIPTTIPMAPLAHGVAIHTAHPAEEADLRHPLAVVVVVVVAAIAIVGTRAFLASPCWCETSAHTSPVTILARRLDALVMSVMYTSQGITTRSRRKALPL